MQEAIVIIATFVGLAVFIKLIQPNIHRPIIVQPRTLEDKQPEDTGK